MNSNDRPRYIHRSITSGGNFNSVESQHCWKSNNSLKTSFLQVPFLIALQLTDWNLVRYLGCLCRIDKFIATDRAGEKLANFIVSFHLSVHCTPFVQSFRFMPCSAEGLSRAIRRAIVVVYFWARHTNSVRLDVNIPYYCIAALSEDKDWISGSNRLRKAKKRIIYKSLFQRHQTDFAIEILID